MAYYKVIMQVYKNGGVPTFETRYLQGTVSEGAAANTVKNQLSEQLRAQNPNDNFAFTLAPNGFTEITKEEYDQVYHN